MKSKERRCWACPGLDVSRRLQFEQFNRLMPELRHEDPAPFINFQRIGARVTKRDTNYRKAIEPGMKIEIALKHLASGDNYSSMKFNNSVREVCQAIVDELQDEVI